MRVHRGHPCDASPEEDAADADALHGLEETAACRDLRRPQWVRDGLAAGRLRGGLVATRYHRRLALRRLYRNRSEGHGECCSGYVVLRANTGEILRLPFA